MRYFKYFPSFQLYDFITENFLTHFYPRRCADEKNICSFFKISIIYFSSCLALASSTKSTALKCVCAYTKYPTHKLLGFFQLDFACFYSRDYKHLRRQARRSNAQSAKSSCCQRMASFSIRCELCSKNFPTGIFLETCKHEQQSNCDTQWVYGSMKNFYI